MKTLIKILVLIVCVVIVWYLFFNTKKEKHDGSAEDANAIPSFSVAQQYARNNEYGKAYRELEKYYEYSPKIIEFTAEHAGAKQICKEAVTDIAYLIELIK